MPDLVDTINGWLLEQALGDEEIETTLTGLADRLLAGGIPIARIGIGRSVLHPVIGLIDTQWERETGRAMSQAVPRERILETFNLSSPFAYLTKNPGKDIHADLTDPEQVKRYEIFADLAAKGLTGYFATRREFGMKHSTYASIAYGFRGATLSFATKRFSGFSQTDRDSLARIVTPLCICLRVDVERFLATEILESYLGRTSGKQVYGGQIARGDVQNIECAIFYSDLRGSVAMSQRLDQQTYLNTVNAYFDCTAKAVDEHGGEVLKFIGDGILAIFPFEDKTRPPANMCAAALASAQEAFARAAHTNIARRKDGLPEIEFGVALHMGEVIYGNVGTEKRLDFTATGPAVGMASRVEALTRELDEPLLATSTFAEFVTQPNTELGQHRLRGFDKPVTLLAYKPS